MPTIPALDHSGGTCRAPTATTTTTAAATSAAAGAGAHGIPLSTSTRHVSSHFSLLDAWMLLFVAAVYLPAARCQTQGN